MIMNGAKVPGPSAPFSVGKITITLWSLSSQHKKIQIVLDYLEKMPNFAPLICSQKEFRGSVYLDIYRALRYKETH